MEPAIDPAAEQQAAGRVHRLGQTNPVVVKRFLYKRTVEDRIGRMHREIKAGRIRIVDGYLPPLALKLLTTQP